MKLPPVEASSSLEVTSVDQKRALATSKNRRWWSPLCQSPTAMLALLTVDKDDDKLY
jgi:hypothetical protein